MSGKLTCTFLHILHNSGNCVANKKCLSKSCEGLSEPEFYGDLVYKFKKLIGINDFSF